MEVRWRIWYSLSLVLYNVVKVWNLARASPCRYWVYEESRGNYFILFARELKIVWGEDGRYWRWIRLPESSHPEIEIAELLKVCWFEVRGKIDASCLSPGMDNIVAFIV
ncbi:hypothetical protein AMTRI_Chr02g255400 [Amborella trichopoda]